MPASSAARSARRLRGSGSGPWASAPLAATYPSAARLSGGGIQQALAGRAGRWVQPGEPAEGGRHVDQLRRRADAPAAELRPGQLEQQRHLQRLAVQVHAVLLFPMLAQPFAVIGEQ